MIEWLDDARSRLACRLLGHKWDGPLCVRIACRGRECGVRLERVLSDSQTISWVTEMDGRIAFRDGHYRLK